MSNGVAVTRLCVWQYCYWLFSWLRRLITYSAVAHNRNWIIEITKHSCGGLWISINKGRSYCHTSNEGIIISVTCLISINTYYYFYAYCILFLNVKFTCRLSLVTVTFNFIFMMPKKFSIYFIPIEYGFCYQVLHTIVLRKLQEGTQNLCLSFSGLNFCSFHSFQEYRESVSVNL